MSVSDDRAGTAWPAAGARTAIVGLLLAFAAVPPAEAGANSALIFDASNSMNSPFDGGSRIEAAKAAIAATLPGFTDRLDLGLVVFGHREKQNCHDVELKFGSAAGSTAQVAAAIQPVSAQGVSSLAQSLGATARALRYRERAATIIALADSAGVDNCRLDTCETIRQLRTESMDLIVHLIAIGAKESDLAQLQCIAAMTGGRFTRVETRGELAAALSSAFALAAEQETGTVALLEPPPRPKPVPRIALADVSPREKPEDGESAEGAGDVAAFATGEIEAETAADEAEAAARVDQAAQVSVFAPTRPGGDAADSEPTDATAAAASGHAVGAAEEAGLDERGADNVSTFAPSLHRDQADAGADESGAADVNDGAAALDAASRAEAAAAAAAQSAPARVLAIADGSEEFTPSLAPPAPPRSTILVQRREGSPPASQNGGETDLRTDSEPSAVPAIGRVKLAALIIENSKPVRAGLEWEVFALDESGAPSKAVARSTEAAPEIEVPAGTYLVKGKFGNATRTQRVAVAADREQDLALVLDAGGLQIDPVNAGTEEPQSAVTNTIYAAGTTSSPIAENVPSGTVVYLNAGVYRIESRYGTANAVARADIEVQPGKLVRAKINHRAGPARFRLLADGGEPLGGVSWQVLASDGNPVAQTDEDEPSIVFAEGSYDVVATQGSNSYRSSFAIKPGEETVVEITAR